MIITKVFHSPTRWRNTFQVNVQFDLSFKRWRGYTVFNRYEPKLNSCNLVYSTNITLYWKWQSILETKHARKSHHYAGILSKLCKESAINQSIPKIALKRHFTKILQRSSSTYQTPFMSSYFLWKCSLGLWKLKQGNSAQLLQYKAWKVRRTHSACFRNTHLQDNTTEPLHTFLLVNWLLGYLPHCTLPALIYSILDWSLHAIDTQRGPMLDLKCFAKHYVTSISNALKECHSIIKYAMLVSQHQLQFIHW
jgi:hypothetical protein